MNKTIVQKIILGMLCIHSFVACKNEKTTPAPATTATTTEVQKEIPKTAGEIVFVNTDTLMTKYDFYNDAKKRLEGRNKNLQKELENRANSIQNELKGYQAKGESMSPKEMEAAQKSLGEKQQKAAEYRQNTEDAIAKELEELDKQFRKKIREYFEKLAKENNYAFILTQNSMGVGMLYGDPTKDITKKAVEDLNTAYKADKK